MTHVLVVDDKEDNVYYLQALLLGHGFSVDTARHGAEALTKARARPPDVVVSDLLMPVMDGYTLLRHWKLDDTVRSVPFVVYTATYTNPEDERLARSMGADDFILKPAEPDDFLACIRAVLARSTVAPAPEAEDGAQVDERAKLQLYSETLIRKLEQKTLELEEANRALRADVAKREAVEAQLRERETLLRMAGSCARLGGFIVRVPGLELVLSDEAAALCDVSQSAITRLDDLLALCAADARAELDVALGRCAADATAFDLELPFTTAKTRRVFLRLTVQAVRDAEGRVACLSGAIQDVDERRKLEEQLRHAQKMDAVGQLAGGVAHDFNNLIAVILGFSGLALVDPGLPARCTSRMWAVTGAGERAAELTRQLLAFSHRQLLAPRVVDVAQVLEGMESMLRRLLSADIGLTLALSPNTGKVLADPSQLDQVVINLVVNARDAMPHGGQIAIDAYALEVSADNAAEHEGVPAGAYVLLSVSDTGTGIDPQVRERIFEPFFTTKEQGRGTGLGRARCSAS